MMDSGTSVIEKEETATVDTLTGDHDRMAHIIIEGYQPDNGEFVALHTVTEGMINQVPVLALCGKVFVPNHNPRDHGICPTCKQKAEELGWMKYL